MDNKAQIIAIDGPSGVGKSTIARMLATKMNWPFLDTGAMFRYYALQLGEEGLRLPPEELARRASAWEFSLQGTGEETMLVCDGKTLGPEIRTEAISQLASRLATRPEIRDILKDAQRRLAATTSLVAEGRDMGTEVFPNARFKFFLDASPEVRAERRWQQMLERGEKADLKELASQARQRDERDRNRAIAPLKAAPDAMVVDTSAMGRDEVLSLLYSHIKESKPDNYKL